jgi:hypothetical protein
VRWILAKIRHLATSLHQRPSASWVGLREANCSRRLACLDLGKLVSRGPGQVSFRKCLEELQVRMQETPFTRVGRCRSASVQWGLHMFNRNTSQEVAIPTLGGILAVAVAAYLAYSGNIPFERVIGFLAGLLGGFFSVLLGRFRVLTPSKLWLLRTPEILLSPIGVILFLPFSLRMAGGYFLGSSASFCFAWAVLALRTRESQGTS